MTKNKINITGRDEYIIKQALAYAITAIERAPEQAGQERSNCEDMRKILERLTNGLCEVQILEGRERDPRDLHGFLKNARDHLIPRSPAKNNKFQTLLHADWSKDPNKRWVARADRQSDGWLISAPSLVGDPKAFVDLIFYESGPLLAGFDFPIGLPKEYVRRINDGAGDFLSLLETLGTGNWSNFFNVARTPGDISLGRPFYPASPDDKQHSKQHLVDALGVNSYDDLKRDCEKRENGESIFWTHHSKQVGKAAIAGWQEVLKPAISRGATIWPFNGSLSKLVASGRPVLAETYPKFAYNIVGLSTIGKKRNQDDRRKRLAGWKNASNLKLTDDLKSLIEVGFGGSPTGEDQFDAFAGLLGMIEVVDGRIPEGNSDERWSNWEGWMLGLNHDRPKPE